MAEPKVSLVFGWFLWLFVCMCVFRLQVIYNMTSHSENVHRPGGLRLAQPGDPTGRVSVLFHSLPEDRSWIQLLKSCDFIIL
jgi:hypothetical protein